MTQEVLVLGGGPTGLEIANELAACGQDVTLIDAEATASRARTAGVAVCEAPLHATNFAVDSAAATVVIATPSDARNLLLGAKAPRAFGAERVVALVNDPDRRQAFEDADIETICVSGTLTRAITDALDIEDLMSSNQSVETDKRGRLTG